MRAEPRLAPDWHDVFGEETSQVVQQIICAIQEIRYGSVEVIIHDAKVVQIERKEKIRFDKS